MICLSAKPICVCLKSEKPFFLTHVDKTNLCVCLKSEKPFFLTHVDERAPATATSEEGGGGTDRTPSAGRTSRAAAAPFSYAFGNTAVFQT